MNQLFRFRSPALAFSFADRCIKAHWVILGDDSTFWVVTMAQGARLLRQGYELAPR